MNGTERPNSSYAPQSSSPPPPSSFRNRNHRQTRNPDIMNARANQVADIFNARNQLSEAFFRRIATGYAHVFPLTARRIIEFGFLLQAVSVLCVFVYLHYMFVRSPITCLDKLRSQANAEPTILDSTPVQRNHYFPGDPNTPNEPWPRYGILRVEVIRNPSPTYSLSDSYAKAFIGSISDHGEETVESADTDESFPDDKLTSSSIGAQSTTKTRPKLWTHDPERLWLAIRSIPLYVCRYFHEALNLLINLNPIPSGSSSFPDLASEAMSLIPRYYPWKYTSLLVDALSYLSALVSGMTSNFFHFCRNVTTWFCNLHATAHEENYIMEYALEYGFLRLSPAMRKRLNITVKLVVLDPDVDACFGGPLSRFLMDEFLGYDDLLLGSIKHLAVSDSVRGHVVNLVTGQQYRWVSSQMSRSSYLAAAIVMLLFTFCVSTILRYSTHQLVAVIADILQLFETNVSIGIPATPFMTVILALIAIETIMSGFFGDSFTAFYVILIVSICDHYEAIFCRTDISRHYWPRFFYLYHFAFYAYHYRFNGRFSSLALWVSWLFTIHSMIYFFHHYELPNLLSDWELRDFLTQVGSDDRLIGRLEIQIRRNQPWAGTLQVIRGSGVTINTLNRQPLASGDSRDSPEGTSGDIASPHIPDVEHSTDAIGDSPVAANSSGVQASLEETGTSYSDQLVTNGDLQTLSCDSPN